MQWHRTVKLVLFMCLVNQNHVLLFCCHHVTQFFIYLLSYLILFLSFSFFGFCCSCQFVLIVGFILPHALKKNPRTCKLIANSALIYSNGVDTPLVFVCLCPFYKSCCRSEINYECFIGSQSDLTFSSPFPPPTFLLLFFFLCCVSSFYLY